MSHKLFLSVALLSLTCQESLSTRTGGMTKNNQNRRHSQSSRNNPNRYHSQSPRNNQNSYHSQPPVEYSKQFQKKSEPPKWNLILTTTGLVITALTIGAINFPELYSQGDIHNYRK